MKTHLILLVSIAAALPSLGHAQSVAGFIGAGISQPLNPFAVRLDTGWNVTGGGGVVGEYAGLMLDISYNEFRNDRGRYFTSGYDQSQRFWAVTLDPIVHLNRRGPVDLYVTGGGGVYGQLFDYGRYGFGSCCGGYGDGRWRSIQKGGVNGGAGLAWRVGFGGLKLFAEARYHHVFTGGSGTSFVPVTLGIRF